MSSAEFAESIRVARQSGSHGDPSGWSCIEGVFATNPISTSPKAIDRYRKICILTLEASNS
jgi:hypothetical protein